MTDQDSGIVKHQITSTLTDRPSSDENAMQAKVPELLKGTLEM